MAKQIIDIGTSPNKGDGDPIRTAFQKINANFNELYAGGFADPANLGTSLLPDADATYDLGSTSKQWGDIHVADFIYLGGVRIEVNSNGALLVGGSNPIQTQDIQGSVFGDDSTLLVDGVNGIIPSANISGTEATNWDTAFGWGDHSAAGYLTSYTVTQADVTTHQAALSITESQISDLTHYDDTALASRVTTLENAGFITSETDSQTLSLVGTDLSITNGNTVDLSGFLTSYTETDPVVGAVTGIVKADGAGNISAAVAGTDYLTSVAFADLTATPTTIAGYGITDAFDGTYASLSGSPTALSNFSNDLDYAGIVGTAIQANGLPSGTEVTDGIFASQGQPLSIGYKDLGGQNTSIAVDETNVQFWKDVVFDNVAIDFTTSSFSNAPWAETSSLATVATSGDYDDLTNKPTDLVRTTMTSSIDANSFDISNLFAITLQTLTSEPLGAAEGTVVIADGTNWNPLGNGRKSMVVKLGGAWREIAAVPGV